MGGQFSIIWQNFKWIYLGTKGKVSEPIPGAENVKTNMWDNVVAVQPLSRVRLFATRGLQHARPPCPSQSPSLFKLMSIELVTPFNHLILCHPLFLLPSIFPRIRVFSNVSALHIRWPNYWSFSISPSNEYSGLISFRIDWFDLLAVQGTLKNLLQHHSSKASLLWHSAFFLAQLSHTWCMRQCRHLKSITSKQSSIRTFNTNYMKMTW